jgi:hypothetical protein
MIDFGIWLNKHKEIFEEDCVGLFSDSYDCFKYDIARPAYLLAYQGLMCYIRSIILRSSIRPEGYSDSEWNDRILRNLRDDASWDKQAFDCTQTIGDKNNKAPILSIRKEVREKFSYWRQLRNSVAHYHEYEILTAHVIALYSFIEQYIETITIEGSSVSLVQKFDDFFNPRITPPNSDIGPLITKISSMVSNDEMDSFFDELYESCEKYNKEMEVFHQIIHAGSQEAIKTSMIDYIKKNKRLLKYYIEEYPNDINYFIIGLTSDRIYQFWHNDLPTYRCKLTLLSILFTAELIKDQECINAIDICLESIERRDGFTDYSQLSESQKEMLKQKGYFTRFIEKYFNPSYTSNNCRKICYNTDFYINTISIMPDIGKEYVEALISIFSANRYPYTLCDRLKGRYKNNEKYREQVDQVCRTENLQLPKEIMPSEN